MEENRQIEGMANDMLIVAWDFPKKDTSFVGVFEKKDDHLFVEVEHASNKNEGYFVLKGYRKADDVIDRLRNAKDTSGLTEKEIEFFVKHNEKVRKETVREILKALKFLYAERQKEYTNWDGNKINAVTTEWLNSDIECIAKEYGVEVEE